MKFAGKVWRLLVGIKDGLALLLLIGFFAALAAILNARPAPGQVREGALLLQLDGTVVEEKTPIDPISLLLSGDAPASEYQARDLVHAIDAAAGDARIKTVVLDLSRFLGGGHVHMQDIGAALDRVRAAKKPVLTYAVAYGDDAMMLAAHASEVWVDPLGGAMIAGPGGQRMYYGALLERLKINARVYKVGKFKSAVEPYTRSDMSPEARENAEALYGSLWAEWKANVAAARPRANLDLVTNRPVEWLATGGGDLATASRKAGLVDKLGDRVEFGNRVASIVGADAWDQYPGSFAYTDFDTWLADKRPEKPGRAIGVVTIAGEIVDGDAGPGTAGGDRIARVLNEALQQDFAGLVVRVDSPGGSVLASEEIRRAILRHKAKGIPIAVSMGNVAASGGYWVSTPADRIFAEPETITGSIGIFAVIPTFENLARDWGVGTDGVRTTPLSGQPDLIAGFTPEVESMLQTAIEDGYRDFLTRVGEARKMAPEQVDRIAQGRVWDGGAARQIGLVDQYGGMEDALAWTAGQAGLKAGGWHAEYLGTIDGEYDAMLREMMGGNDRRAAPADLFALAAGTRQTLLATAHADVARVMQVRGMQALCLECSALRPSRPASALERTGWLERALALFD